MGRSPSSGGGQRLSLTLAKLPLVLPKLKWRWCPSWLHMVAILAFSLLLLFVGPSILGWPQAGGFHIFEASADEALYAAPCCADAVCVLGANDPHEIAQAVAEKTRSDRKLRIGFVTYATGPYNAFVEDLWGSLQRHAFKRHDVHLFVFTDKAGNASFLPHPRVHRKYQGRSGWPFDSLGRHFLYLRYLAWFDRMDYVYSVDSDALIVDELDERILGERVGALSAWPYGFPSSWFSYDRRRTPLPMNEPFSSAYLTEEHGKCYFAGGLFGGTFASFGAILRETTALARVDLSKTPPRIAIWHDESYLNRVFAFNPPTVVLGPHYVYPEPPVDRGLTADTHPVRHLWLQLQKLQIRPKLLNLGVRKHVQGTLNEYQPASSTIPGFMSLSGKPEFFQIAASPRDVAARVTFVAKAFERPMCLSRLLDSIARTWRDVPVLVLDDSAQAILGPRRQQFYTLKLPRLQYLRADFDVGLAAGRNTLIDNVQTPYALLLDDDFVLSGDTHVERLLDVLEWGRFDMVGGCIDSAYGYTLVPNKAELEVRPDMPCEGWASRPPDYQSEHLACWQVDMINNMFAARTDFLRQVRWDGRLKLGEHEDFFLRVAQAKGRVGLCRGVTAVNDNSCDVSSTYKAKRGRVFENWVTFFDKHGLTEMRTAAGRYVLQCNASVDAAATNESLATELRRQPAAGVRLNGKGQRTGATAHDITQISSPGESTEGGVAATAADRSQCKIEVYPARPWFEGPGGADSVSDATDQPATGGWAALRGGLAALGRPLLGWGDV